MAKFEIGKSYAHNVSAHDGHGKRYTLTEKFTVIKRTSCYVTFSKTSAFGSYQGTKRRKILTHDYHDEYVQLDIMNGYLYAENIITDDSQPEPATADDTNSASDNDNATASQPAILANAESLPPENLCDDGSFSEAPGDNSCPEQDIPDDYSPDAIPDENPGFIVIPADQAVFLREAEHSPALDIPPEDRIREPYFPPEKFINVWPADLGSFAFSYKISKKDCTLNYTVRLVDSENSQEQFRTP